VALKLYPTGQINIFLVLSQ